MLETLPAPIDMALIIVCMLVVISFSVYYIGMLVLYILVAAVQTVRKEKVMSFREFIEMMFVD